MNFCFLEMKTVNQILLGMTFIANWQSKACLWQVIFMNESKFTPYVHVDSDWMVRTNIQEKWGACKSNRYFLHMN